MNIRLVTVFITKVDVDRIRPNHRTASSFRAIPEINKGSFQVTADKFGGWLDGKYIKVIVETKSWKTMYFAQSKNFDTNTPHFEVRVDGKMEVHEDSPDHKCYRAMNVQEIHSGSFGSGTAFAENQGLDIAILPMFKTAKGFMIDTTASGSYVKIQSPSEWCLIALGKYGPWKTKPPKS